MKNMRATLVYSYEYYSAQIHIRPGHDETSLVRSVAKAAGKPLVLGYWYVQQL